MRALIVSDIHANIDALEAVLSAAPAHDVMWNLGDTVGYGAAPNEVVDRVRAIGGIFVRGNHDRACSGARSFDDFSSIAGRAAKWTRSVLTAENSAWLRELAKGPVAPGSPLVTCVHGSLLHEDQYVVSMRDAWLAMKDSVSRVTFFGHTHVQGGFAASAREWQNVQPEFSRARGLQEMSIVIKPDRRYLLNPGSVGQPRDNDPRAAFAIYDDDAQIVTFYRVDYDIRLAQMRILQAKLPERLAQRLIEGR
jgi:diadenosine tetraphosphatase ApaH/serine/threonine PP2A family protein phosphatase